LQSRFFMIDSGTLLQRRFLVEEKIGVGGMGAVYRAVDQKFGSMVAIKETFYGGTELGEAFEREARLLNGLHHPILPHVSDYFSENDGHFLVMEFIEGDDLSELLKRGETFAVSTVMGWAMEILDGLDYLHSQNPPIIHRDIKPNNLKLTSRGRIVLLDFGMAKETSHNTLGAKSVFGYSRRYSPLEQIEGTGTDERSDIFALGATLYHLLTGKAPADALARASAIVAGRPDSLVPVNSVNTDVPESVAAILNAALALNPDNRFETARAMSNALEYAIGTNPIAQKPENEHVVAHAANGVDRQAEAAATADEASGGTGGIPEQVPFAAAGSIVPESESLQNFPRPEAVDEKVDTTAPSLRSDGVLSGLGDVSAGSSALRSSPVPRLRSRKAARPGYVYWVPALLIGLALVLFGTYRAFRSEQVSDEPATQVTSPPVSNESTESATVESPEDVTSESADGLENRAADNVAEHRSDGASAPEDEDSQTQIDNPINLKKGPINARPESAVQSRVEPKRAAKAAAPEAKTTAVSRNINNKKAPTERAPKTVRPAFEQPRVSSIEAIFTGVPYERRRRWESDRDLSFEDEMRRRRIRQIMRENRRRQLPF
jgi:serine/threonine protein kinase